MSVAELIVAGGVIVTSIVGIHELFRIHQCRSSLNIIARTFAAKNSYRSLSHLIDGTFEAENTGHSEQNRLTADIERTVEKTLSSPSLRGWMHSGPNTDHYSGLRVWLSGPHITVPDRENKVTIQICIRTWLEPLLGIISDRRNCLGQFSPSANINAGRGLSLSVTATRGSGLTIPPYLQGTISFGRKGK
jgi:hypothetical protein